MLKKPAYFFSFMRLSRKCSSRSGGAGGGDGGERDVGGGGATRNSSSSSSGWRRWRLRNMSAGLRWKRKSSPFSFHLWLVDGILFKILSFFEAVVLVSTLAFFYLCCGCHI